jgi:hypothetical protein
MNSPQLFNLLTAQQQQQQQQTSTSLRKGNRLSASYDDLPLAAALQQQQVGHSFFSSSLSSLYLPLPLLLPLFFSFSFFFLFRDQHFIGSYRLGRTLGTGSFGKVKLGTNVWTGEQVAIKSIPLGRKDYRLEREIENLKSLGKCGAFPLLLPPLSVS